jgi:predicted ATPase
VEHLRKGQQVVERRPPGKEREELELSLLIALGPALMATRGWNAPEVAEVYSRARALATERGRSTDVFPAVWGRWLVAHAGGEAAVARELLAELFTLLRDASDAPLLLQAHHAGASTACSEAELSAAIEHLDAVRRLYRLDEHREQALVYGGHDPCVCALSMGALVQLMRGELGESRALSHEAITLAARVGHVPSVAHAAWYRAELSHILGDVAEAEARARETLAVASEKGIAHYAAWALMLLGWAMVTRGDTDAGLAKMEDGRVALRATDNQYHIPHRLTVRAQALAAAGRTDAARDAIEEALTSVARTGEVWYQPEVLRLKAEILQAAPTDLPAAQRCLEQALAAARARSATFWELRAAVALARLLAAQGRHASARGVLTPALARFDESRELPEVARAFALLERLAG